MSRYTHFSHILLCIISLGIFSIDYGVYAGVDTTRGEVLESSTGSRVIAKKGVTGLSIPLASADRGESILEMNNSIVAWCKTQTDIDHRKIEKAFRKIYENDNDYLDALKSIRKTYILQKRKFEASLEDAEYSSQRNIFELLWVPCLTYRIDSIEKKIQNIEK